MAEESDCVQQPKSDGRRLPDAGTATTMVDVEADPTRRTGKEILHDLARALARQAAREDYAAEQAREGKAAERYAAKVAAMHAALARGDDAGQEAIALVRELVTRVRVIPRARGASVGLEIAGDLAAILSVNETGAACMVSMVAGVRFELTTFRL